MEIDYYRKTKALFRFLFFLKGIKPRVRGLENFVDGSAIFVANHESSVDSGDIPALLPSLAGRIRPVGAGEILNSRKLRDFAKDKGKNSIFVRMGINLLEKIMEQRKVEDSFLYYIAKRLDGIMLSYSRFPHETREALKGNYQGVFKEIEDALSKGHKLLVFPEGLWYEKGGGKCYSQAGLFSLIHKVPIIPIRKETIGKRITLDIKKPIYPEKEYPVSIERARELTLKAMESVYAKN